MKLVHFFYFPPNFISFHFCPRFSSIFYFLRKTPFEIIRERKYTEENDFFMFGFIVENIKRKSNIIKNLKILNIFKFLGPCIVEKKK